MSITKKEKTRKKMEERRQKEEEEKKKKVRGAVIWGLIFIGVAIMTVGLVKLDRDVSKGDKGGKHEKADVINAMKDDDHIIGDKNKAKVVVAEYSNFTCPACSYYHPQMEKLAKEFPSEVVKVFRHFPFHTNAMEASWASEAANKQGKFWEMSSILFEKQDEWKSKTVEGNKSKVDFFIPYTESLKLDINQFKNDYESDAVHKRVERDAKESKDTLGLEHTPTIFVNGKEITGEYKDFKAAVQKEINKANEK